MFGRRTIVNFIAFLVISTMLIGIGLSKFILVKGGGRVVRVEFADATGLAARNDVTMRGVPVGIIRSVDLESDGNVDVEILLDPGETVPKGSKAQLTRRSAIGDIVLELTPGSGPALPDGGTIPMRDTSNPPDPERTIEVLTQVLHAVPSGDLTTVVHELANALRGRGGDLASLSETTADLPETLLTVRRQLEELIRKGPQVTGVLAGHAKTLADDLRQTALLADLLRDNRNQLVALTKNGASFAGQANDLIAKHKANLACLIADLGTVNATLAQPGNAANLAGTLDLNHYFFDGVWSLVMHGKDGLDWFRVQLLPGQQPPGQAYPSLRDPPDVYGADACRSIYGRGVGAGSQPGALYLAPGSNYIPGS